MTTQKRFDGSDQYVATQDLKLAVNAALTLQRPLLIKQDHAGQSPDQPACPAG